MILTPHAIVGAVITNLLPHNPALGFGLAYASHYLLDLIPHKDYEVEGFVDDDTKTVKSIITDMKARLHFLFIGGDFLIGIIICGLLFVRDEKSFYLTLLGIAAGVLPDFLQFLYLKWKREPWIFFQKVHDYFHNEDKMEDRIITGYFIQFIVVTFFIASYLLLTGYKIVL